MARRIETFTITQEGRDKGKVFRLEEMPASQAEAWATRALLALGRSGANIPQMLPSGMAALYAIGLNSLAGLRWEDAQPLLAEMFACIKIIATPSMPEATTRALVEEDIEEVQTRFLLRERVLSLHLGFSLAAKRSTYLQALSAAEQASSSPNTSMSPQPSGEPSAADLPPSTSSIPATA